MVLGGLAVGAVCFVCFAISLTPFVMGGHSISAVPLSMAIRLVGSLGGVGLIACTGRFSSFALGASLMAWYSYFLIVEVILIRSWMSSSSRAAGLQGGAV